MKTLLPVLFLIASVAPAGAVIIRHDVPDAEYVVADADYPALVALFDGWDCTASLVHESFLLTVAHCAMDLEAGDSIEIAGAPRAIAEVILHPGWRDEDNFDIALIRLEQPVAGVAPLPIYRGSSELGATITIVGRGVTATGLEGEDGAESDMLLRAATNEVSAVGDHFIEVIFERGGEAGVTDREGVGASGDSGGPALIEVGGGLAIAGLNSWGEGDDGVGTYGARDYQTRVSRYRDWIDGIVGATGPGGDDPGDPDGGGDDGDVDPGDVGSGGCSSGGDPRGALALLLIALLLTARAGGHPRGRARAAAGASRRRRSAP